MHAAGYKTSWQTQDLTRIIVWTLPHHGMYCYKSLLTGLANVACVHCVFLSAENVCSFYLLAGKHHITRFLSSKIYVCSVHPTFLHHAWTILAGGLGKVKYDCKNLHKIYLLEKKTYSKLKAPVLFEM